MAAREDSSTDPWRYACPECDSTRLRDNQDGSKHCGSCFAHIEEPIDRKEGS